MLPSKDLPKAAATNLVPLLLVLLLLVLLLLLLALRKLQLALQAFYVSAALAGAHVFFTQHRVERSRMLVACGQPALLTAGLSFCFDRLSVNDRRLMSSHVA